MLFSACPKRQIKIVRRKKIAKTDPTRATREILCELLALFYTKGWVAGTGGGICAAVAKDRVLMAPTGVHKERVRPTHLFVVDPRSGEVVLPPRNRELRLSECGAIFCLLINRRGAGSVMHSHALSAVLAADLALEDRTVLEGLEMLKGIRGVANVDRHSVPVIQNTPREPELAVQIEKILEEPGFVRSFCILVKDHGAYIWGRDLWETKRHAEVYHFLFEAAVARSSLKIG
jgi:methylthioribulose-1-phosphate dehydratase